MGTAATLSMEILVLFGSFDGSFAELLEILHEIESGLAGAGAGGFVSLLNLSVCVDNEELVLCLDFLNKFFHD